MFSYIGLMFKFIQGMHLLHVHTMEAFVEKDPKTPVKISCIFQGCVLYNDNPRRLNAISLGASIAYNWLYNPSPKALIYSLRKSLSFGPLQMMHRRLRSDGSSELPCLSRRVV
jgi:hypothetical protein